MKTQGLWSGAVRFVHRCRGPLLLFTLFIISPLIARPFSTPTAPADSVSMTVQVVAGWNLLSLPVAVANGAREAVFPTSVSNAIGHDGGYGTLDTLRPGHGFWIKFAAPETIAIFGTGVYLDSIPLREGWNLVGAVSTPVAAAFIETAPTGLLTSKFFRYRPGTGFSQVDTLWPGSGHWVKASGGGRMRIMARDVPCPGVPTVDAGGKTYETVQIGNQCWLRRNIDAGERIDGGIEQRDNGTVEKYCFNDQPVNCTYYGGLYQWDEAMHYDSTGDARGICPPGWHVPTRGDFATLVSSVNGDGNALKAQRQGVAGGIGTNTSGFSALLSGYRHLDGNYSIQGYMTYLRTSTDTAAATALSAYLFAQYDDVYFLDNNKAYGFGVRCIRDGAGAGTREQPTTEVRPGRF